MNLRLCLPSDAAEWLRLRCELWPELEAGTQRREMVAWLARADAVALVAVRPDGTRLGGFAEVGARSVADGCDTSPVAYLEGWFVEEDLRLQGVGAALVRAAETWARAQGFREFASDVELENVESQRAHVAVGFREVERSVLYVKTLSPRKT